MRKNKQLKFESSFDYYPDVISPSKSSVPAWVKDTPKWKDQKPNVDSIGKTFKNCSSFLDSFLLGYVVTLPFDLTIEQGEFGPILRWTTTEPLAGTRDSVANSAIPIPQGYSSTHFVWSFPASLEIPKGYSALLTHPLNRHDLPFLTLSGVVDGEFTIYSGGLIPFFVSSSFEGIVPQGTPIAQVIPFKRDSWQLKPWPGLLAKGELLRKKSLSKIEGWYKTNIWVKKPYL